MKLKKDVYGLQNRFIYRAINLSVVLLLLLSLFFSLQSNLFIIDKLSDQIILFCFVIVMIVFLITLFDKNNIIFSKLLFVVKKHSTFLFWSFFLLCIIYQFFLLSNLKGSPIFDAALLISGIKDPSLVNEYLSINSNNRFIYFFNYFLSFVIGNKISDFQAFNAVLIFLSMILFKQIMKKAFNKQVAYISTAMLMFFCIVQPLYLVPYTDTYCLFPLFLSLLFFIYCIDTRDLKKVIVFASLSAYFFTITFFIRPSAIIFIIAFLFLGLINFKNKRIFGLLIITIPTYVVVVILTFFNFNYFINSQTIVNIDRTQEIPMTHFILLGSFGDEDKKNSLHGTWNSEDVTLANSGKTKAEKNKNALEAFLKRTKKRGFAKSIKFYLQKYSQNTDSGVIGYHRDGLWFRGEFSKKDTTKNSIQQIYYEDGYLRPTFNFICQIIWIFILYFAIRGSLSSKNIKVCVITLTLFGGLLFLEIFESGGTKYLLQYIPFICALSGIGSCHQASRWMKKNRFQLRTK